MFKSSCSRTIYGPLSSPLICDLPVYSLDFSVSVWVDSVLLWLSSHVLILLHILQQPDIFQYSKIQLSCSPPTSGTNSMQDILFHLLFIIYLCTHGPVRCVQKCMLRSEDHLLKSSSLFHHRIPGIKWRHQAWWHMPLPTKPSHWTHTLCFVDPIFLSFYTNLSIKLSAFSNLSKTRKKTFISLKNHFAILAMLCFLEDVISVLIFV